MHPPRPVLNSPDYAKAFGILLVVFGHTLHGLMASGTIAQIGFWARIYHLIYLFHMPLFFYISGLFFAPSLKRAGYGALMRKNALYLLVPMIIWSYLQFTLQYMATRYTNNHLSFIEVLTAPFPPKQQFWFLGALYVIMVLVGALYKTRPARKTLWIITLALFAVPLAGMGYNPENFSGDSEWLYLAAQILLNAPYFLLGMLLNPSVMAGWRVSNKTCLLTFTLSLFVYHTSRANLIHPVASVCCVLAVYKFMTNLDGKGQGLPAKIAAFIGMNSLIIYLAHVIFAATFRALLFKLDVLSGTVQLAGGTLVGLLGPLTLVPIGLIAASHSQPLAQAVLPVRSSR